jgi:glycosyltransferase involved in cell wall biosynthesis
MTPRRRVLLVGKGSPERGGIPTFIEMIRYGALAERYDVSFLNLARAGERQGGRLSGGNIRRTAVDAAAVWRAAGASDVVHIHTALAPGVTLVRAGVLAASARLRRSRVVVHGHGGMIQLWLTTRRRRAVARAALRAAHHVVAVSTEGRDVLTAVLGPAHVSLVDNSVDTSTFVPDDVANDPPRILYVGLLTPRKGVVDLLHASAELTRRGVRHQLQLVGGEPDEGSAAEGAVRAVAPDASVFAGTRTREEMPAVYRDADVFCLPSWWEAMPLSVLEAMASGRPVVATAVGDVARAVVDGTTGLVVPPRDPAALADALERVLTDAGLRAAMGGAGRAHVVRHFSSDAMTAALQRLYDGV